MMMIAGHDGDTSILQPLWHPQTGDLYYISDQSDFYNMYRYSSSSGESKCILPMEFDFGGAAPGWMLGQQGFGFLKDGRLLAQYKKDGKSVLLVIDVTTESVEEFGMDDGLPVQFGGMISGDEKDGDLYFLGASPSTSTSISNGI
jgi:hypothetical protein